MDSVGEYDILTLSVSVFKIFGEGNRHHEDRFIYIFRFINVCVFIWNLVIMLGSITYVEEYVYIKIIEGVMTCSHTLLKYICFIYYKSGIEVLLDDLQYFWKTSDVDEVNRKATITYKYLLFGQRVYMVAGLTFMLIYDTKPLLAKGERFIFETWPILNSTVTETFVLFSQYYFLLMCIPIIAAYDTLYLAYAFHVIMQLNLLRYAFEHIAPEDDVKKIYGCVKQHQLLLSVFDRMRGIYFWMLLLHYAITLIAGCSRLYILLITQPGPLEMTASLIYICAVFVEFAGYTFPVEYIVFQLKDISRAVYMSSWYKRSVNERQDLLIVMLKSQRQKYLSAAGLIDMNVDTFGMVARKIFSFYVILRNILNK